LSVKVLRSDATAAPDYINAMFNLALLLQQNGAYAEAAISGRIAFANLLTG
jgi:hypothetical protein